MAEEPKPDMTRATLGQRIAILLIDGFASWWFLLAFVIVLSTWITINTINIGVPHFDPEPYIELNLVLSCIAAIQAPIVMIGGKLEALRSRLTAEMDLAVDKATSEIIREMYREHKVLTEEHASLVKQHGEQTELLKSIANRIGLNDTEL